MAFELVYTSVPSGLKAGTRGFCTVAFTEGMPVNYVQLAESLSSYKNIFQPNDPLYARNPVAYTHYRFSIGGQRLNVLSRVASYGTDYSGRTNKLAHHILARSDELSEGGPASIMAQDDFFVSQWTSDPGLIAGQKQLPVTSPITGVSTNWQRVTGDAGWAGVLAQSYLDGPQQSAYVVFEPGTSVLPLLAEAFALLPSQQKWNVTFSTYVSTLPQGSDCWCRCCLPDSPMLRDARRTPGTLLINLSDISASRGPSPSTCTSALVECARSGQRPVWQAPTSPEVRSVAPPVAPGSPAPAPSSRPPLPHTNKNRPAKIGIDYSSALRPKAPAFSTSHAKKSGTPFFPLVLAGCILAAVVLLVVVALWILMESHEAGDSHDSRLSSTGIVAQTDTVPLEMDDALVVGNAEVSEQNEILQRLSEAEASAEEAKKRASTASKAAMEGDTSSAEKQYSAAGKARANMEGQSEALDKLLQESLDSEFRDELEGRLDDLRNLKGETQEALEKAQAEIKSAKEAAKAAQSPQITAPRVKVYDRTNAVTVTEITIPSKADRGADALLFFDASGARIPTSYKKTAWDSTATYSRESSKEEMAKLVEQHLDLYTSELCAISMRSAGSPVEIAWFGGFTINVAHVSRDGDDFRISEIPDVLCETRGFDHLKCVALFDRSQRECPADFSLEPLSEGRSFLCLRFTKQGLEQVKADIAKRERSGPAAPVSSQPSDDFSSTKLAELREEAKHLSKKTRLSVQDRLREFLNAADRYRESDSLNAALERVVAGITKEARNRESSANASLATKTKEFEACKKHGGKDVKEKLRALRLAVEKLKDQAERHSKLKYKLDDQRPRDRIQLWKNLTIDSNWGTYVDNAMLCWVINGKFLDDLLEAAKAPEPQQEVPDARPLQLTRVIFKLKPSRPVPPADSTSSGRQP